MNRNFAIVLCAAVLLTLMVIALVRQSPGNAQGPAQPRLVPPSKRELIGTTSCSASVCHGGSDLGQPRSEATTWRALDPHARAFDTLLTPQSKAIARHLWGNTTLAHEAPRCLKCHVHPEYDSARPNFRAQDGVGCEGCHGAAQDWLTPHYRAAWNTGDKQGLGMLDTKSLPGRASICVTCHVGTASANVDHDLIAAGHPALRFEFASYFANLPPHWDVARDKRANSTDAGKSIDFEARSWALGQLVTASSALELLAHRADPALGKPWPELAEFDCFSCHHDLQSASWRQKDKHLSKRRPGSLVWNRWYLDVVSDAKINDERFSEFRKHIVNRAELARHAKDAAAGLRNAARDRPLRLSLEAMANRGESASSWDEATHRYLALMAIQQHRADNKQMKDEALERRIAALREAVAFPSGYNSPHGFESPGMRVVEKEK